MGKRIQFPVFLLLTGLLVVQLGGLIPAVEAQEGSSAVVDLAPVHDFHVNEFGLECTDCHNRPDSPTAGQELSFSVRPGHSNCDACHEDIFEEGELVSFCMVCHEGEVYDLSSFPSGMDSIALFSHAQHVDFQGRVNRQTGRRQDCSFCHLATGQTAGVSMPAHPQCVACHAGTEAVSPMLSEEGGNDGCLSCHNLTQVDKNILTEALPVAETAEPLMAAAQTSIPHEDSYEEVLPFPHGSHVETLDGAVIRCETCHESVLERADLEMKPELPDMSVCASCHDSATKVGEANLTENCELCHSTIQEELRPGLAELVIPVAHTPSFLRNHQMQAHESAAYCNICHNLTHSSSDNCADCHSIMQPKSHLALRFNETTHGRMAAMDREQCATCHVVDFCSSCHNLPPRSHNPLPLFAGGGLHRNLAAFNLRSCLTCHTFEDTCSQCHEQVLR
jgi:hypothetical protein